MAFAPLKSLLQPLQDLRFTPGLGDELQDLALVDGLGERLEIAVRGQQDPLIPWVKLPDSGAESNPVLIGHLIVGNDHADLLARQDLVGFARARGGEKLDIHIAQEAAEAGQDVGLVIHQQNGTVVRRTIDPAQVQARLSLQQLGDFRLRQRAAETVSLELIALPLSEPLQLPFGLHPFLLGGNA